jgi:hypothetical protein
MPGPSGYTTAFTHPDPLDPNDVVRQKTQSRAPTYPYDMQVSYGASSHAGMDGDERQDGADDGPPLGRQHSAPRPMSVWDRMSDAIDHMDGLPYLDNGPESALADTLGYGNHGRMGELAVIMGIEDDGPDDTLLKLLSPDEQDEERDTYGCWAGRVIGREE